MNEVCHLPGLGYSLLVIYDGVRHGDTEWDSHRVHTTFCVRTGLEELVVWRADDVMSPGQHLT